LVVSFLLSFMLLSGMLSLYNLKGLSLELVPPKEVLPKGLKTLNSS